MTSQRRGLTLIEGLLAFASVAVVLALTLPALAGARSAGQANASMANLMTLGLGHALYANDWDGRQATYIVDDISSYGTSVGSAFNGYTNAQGGYGDPDNWHPPITLGWGEFNPGQIILFAFRCNGNLANASLTVPINFDGGVLYNGSHRFINTRQFRQYLSNRFYDPAFYAPSEPVVYPTVEPFFDDPHEFVYTPPVPGIGDMPRLSSYVTSAAAMFHPDVMRHPDDGGWQDPWSIDHGMQSPGLFTATYPSLKTLMLEHHWLQDAPDDTCNPNFKPGLYDGCEPYYFNHSIDSAPATLFYDFSTDFLANADVQAADQQLIDRTGHGLWSRDTAFGADGYLNGLGYDNPELAHHVLTTDGILGRDRIED